MSCSKKCCKSTPVVLQQASLQLLQQGGPTTGVYIHVDACIPEIYCLLCIQYRLVLLLVLLVLLVLLLLLLRPQHISLITLLNACKSNAP